MQLPYLLHPSLLPTNPSFLTNSCPYASVILPGPFPLHYKVWKILFSKAGPSLAGRYDKEGQDRTLSVSLSFFIVGQNSLKHGKRRKAWTNICELFPSYHVLHVHPLEIYSKVVKSWVVMQSLGEEGLDSSSHTGPCTESLPPLTWVCVWQCHCSCCVSVAWSCCSGPCVSVTGSGCWPICSWDVCVMASFPLA